MELLDGSSNPPFICLSEVADSTPPPITREVSQLAAFALLVLKVSLNLFSPSTKGLLEA